MQGFGRKREEEEEQKRVQQQTAADSSQNSAVIRGREHAKETAGALKQTGHKIVAEQKVNPFEQTAQKTNAQLLADYDAEMAGREGMAMGMTPRRDLGTRDVEVDFSTIKDNKQAAYFAGTLANEDVAEEFLKDWAAYSAQDSDEVLYSAEGLLGDKLFAAPRSEKGKNAAKADAAMQTLASGLVMDADGNDMDLASASLPMVIQSIRADPDSSSRKAKVKALYTLTQTPGNPYSGRTFDQDEANTFLYSADWDDKDYKDAVDEYQSAFYAGSGHDEDNLKKYLELVAGIGEGNEYGDAYSKRQSRSMRAALDKAWASATGLPAPTDEDIAAWNELNQTAQAEGKKASPFFTWLFGDKKRKAEKESARESAQPEQASTLDQIASTDGVKRAALTASTAPGIALPQEGSKSGGRWFDAAQKQAEEKTEAAQAPTAQKEDKRRFDQIYEHETPTPIAQRESAGTPGEALAMYLRGEPLTQEEHEWLDDILNSNGGKLLLNQKEYVGGTLTNGMDYRAKPLYPQGAIPSDVGSWIQQDLDILGSGMLDDATAGAGYLALMQIINDADAWIESGEVSIPSGKNPYSVYLSTHDSAKAVSQSIREAQIIAIEQQKSAAQAQKQAEEEANQSLVNAVTAGTATPEQIDEYYDRYHRHQYTVLELENRDEGYRIFDRNLSNVLNADDGAYWSSDSAAAQEGLEGEARTEFREVLADEAQSVLHEYADIANSLGMTTQDYLEKCGVTSPDQIADMAYNRMVRRGSAFLSSETAQAGLEDNSATIGVLPAAGAGAAYGVLSTADSLASAPYNMLDAMAYKANVNEIRSDYNGKYGINGRAIYREQLIQYANSGELSEEQSAALLQNIGQVSDIYDIGYKIDNGFIGNGYRAFMGAMDNAQKGLTDFASLGNEFEQNVFSGSASIAGSATGMLAVGALGAAGTPAMAASAAIYGTQAWNDNYEAAVSSGLSKPTAAALAMGPAVISTVINAPGAKMEGDLLGGRSLLEQQLAKQDALKTLTLRGKFAEYAKALARDIPKNAVQEGTEELAEDAATNLYNAMLYPVALKMDAGEKPQFSDVLAGLVSVDPAEMMTSGGKSFLGGAAASVVFTLAGYAGMAIRRKLPGYRLPAVTLSQEMMDGTADVTPENLTKVTESLAEALQNPEVAQAVNETAQQAQDAQNTAAAAMAGVGAEHFEAGNAQVRMQQEAQTAADAAQQAADAAKSEFEAYSDAVMAGDIDKIKDMQQARVRMGENQKTANEYADTAKKHKAAAEDAYAKGLDEARKRGAQISKEQNAQTVAQWQAEMETMSRIADIDAEMDSMRQSYADAETMGLDEDVKQAIESRIDELRRERVEIAMPGIEEATQTRERLEQGLAQAQELGLDEDTRAEMERQVELAKAKERIYTQSRSDWELEETLYPNETGSSKTAYVNNAKPDARYANPDAEVQLTGEAEQASSGIAQEESRTASDGRPGKTVVSTTFEEQYAPELKTMDAIIKAGRQAEALAQALKDGDPVSATRIAEIQNSVNEHLSKLDDNALNVFASEVNDALRQIGELEIETDAARERDTARQEADYERYMSQAAQKQLAAEHYNALSGVAKTLRGTDVFINESQAADILNMTGLKTIPRVNIAYGTRFTQNRESGAIPLDGQFYVGLAEESGGYMDAASLNPHEDIMRALMKRKQSYREMHQKVEEPKDRAQIRRAAKAVMEGDVGGSAQGEQKRTYRGVEVEQAEGKSQKNNNIVKTVKKLAQDIGVGSTLGARNMSEAQGGHGLYRDAMRYMATDAVSAGRVDINMHEIGHAISERTGITGTPEMVAALKAENASWEQSYTDAEMAGEAMAEFTWRYMVSDEAAKEFAGEGFFAQFEQAVADAGMEKPIAKAKTDIRNYLNASFSERVRAMVVDRSDIKSNEKLDEAFLYALVDSTAPAEKANKIIRDATGEKVVAFEDNLRESALLRNTADKRAYAQLTESLTDVRGTRIGDSLKERIKESGLKGKDLQEWLNWMLVKHSLDRDKQGKPVLDNNTYPRAERLAYIQQTERAHPEFAKAQKAFQSFRHDFMQAWMVDTGYLKAWQLEQFEAMYPSYVPTNRVKDNAPVGRSRSGGGKSYTIRGAKGSTEQIVSPFDSFCEMTQKIVRMNMENQTNLLFDRLYKEYEGFGVLGRPIEQTSGTFSDEQTLTRMESARESLQKGNVSEDVITDILLDIDADRAKFVGTANENNVITVQHPDGSKTYYTITDPLFYKMMTNATDNGKSILNVVGKFTHAMSALTTGSNPVFAARNFLRDFQNSVNYGTWATSYADGLYKWVKAVHEILTDKDAYKDYVALGGGGWTRVSTGDAKSSKQLRGAVFDNGKWKDNYETQTLGGKGKWAGKKLWEFATLAYPNEVIEQASRFAEYRYGKHDLTTDTGRAEAFRAAQDVTVDFSRRGASGIARNISDFVPFFNASLQGTYRTARQGTKQESGQAAKRFVKTLLNTGALVALANAALLGMNDDDKEAFMYMSDDLKSKHIFIPNFAPGVFGDAPLIRIPVEQDPVAYAVNSLMTNVMWKGEGDEWAIDFTASMATIADGLYPISGTIADPILSMQTNKNWYGSRIVPSYMENWDPSTQYTEDTAGLFVGVGRFIGKSPMMLQYVAQQYTGYLGQVVIPAMSDMDASNPATALFSSTVAYARKQLTSNPLVSNDVVSRVNDNTKFLNTVVKAGENGKEFNMLRGDLTPRQAQKAYDVAYDLTHSGGVLYEAKQAISEGYEQIDAINGRDDLTDEQKYELTNSIRMKMCRLALKANEVYAKYEELYVTGESLRSHIIKQAYGGTTIKKQK
nr:MAG TPA: Type I restriction enzyme Methylase [Caudoviricetes sp.]